MTLPTDLAALADRLTDAAGRSTCFPLISALLSEAATEIQLLRESRDKFQALTEALIKAEESRERREARSLASRDGGGWPKGYVMTLENPTTRMEDVGLQWLVNSQHMRKQDRRNAIAQAYAAMLKAAPPPAKAAPLGDAE